jgi:hypothetical protein
MANFLDEVMNFVKPKQPEFLQELVEPENKIPQTANTENKTSE